MAYCRNCGTQLDDNDQFCYSCGASQVQDKQYNEGYAQQVACQTPEQQQLQIQGIDTQKIKNYVNEVLKITKSMTLAPVSSIRVIARKPYKQSSFIMSLMVALAEALLFLWSCNQLLEKITGSNFTLSSKSVKYGDPNISYGKFFVCFILIYFMSAAVLFGCIYLLGHYVFKGKSSILSLWNVVVCSGLPYAGGLFIGLILSYINITLGMAVILIGVLISLFCLYAGTADAIEISDNDSAFIIPPSAIAMLIANIFFYSKVFHI